jgi:hypothetical protein
MWAYLSPSKLFGDATTSDNGPTFTGAEAKNIASLKAVLEWLDNHDG